jgi:ABC-2 type transport system ATP-binding protein
MLLPTENLTKDYGRFRALDALNLEVAPGEVVGLLGPNGSAKTLAERNTASRSVVASASAHQRNAPDARVGLTLSAAAVHTAVPPARSRRA